MRSMESASMGWAIWGDSPRRRMAATKSMASATIRCGAWPCSFRSRSSSFVSVPAHTLSLVRILLRSYSSESMYSLQTNSGVNPGMAASAATTAAVSDTLPLVKILLQPSSSESMYDSQTDSSECCEHLP